LFSVHIDQGPVNIKKQNFYIPHASSFSQYPLYVVLSALLPGDPG